MGERMGWHWWRRRKILVVRPWAANAITHPWEPANNGFTAASIHARAIIGPCPHSITPFERSLRAEISNHMVIRLAVLCLLGAGVNAFAPAPRVPSTAACRGSFAHERICIGTAPVMCEYSTKVKMTAETRAPLRQARIFFLYPSVIAGASIASYVSILRVIGGKDSNPGNLVVNLAVIAAAVWGVRKDLQGRAELLDEVAIELGEKRPSASDSNSNPDLD